jgi:hypothetical protein
LPAVAFAVLGLALVPLASGARATFPGASGLLAFQSSRDGGYELYVAAADGSNARKLLALPATNEFNPAWSPSGRRLAYQVGPPDDSGFDIALVNADGRGRAQLVTGPTDDRAPQFCDEDTLVFTRQLSPTSSDVYAIDTNGSNLRRLTDHPAADSFPTCHPRGDRVAFISGRDGQPRIYEVRLDGSNLRPLADAPSLDPDYAPDGSAIAYVAPDPADRNLEVFTKDLGSGQVVQRTRSAPPLDYRLPKLAPAGAGTVLATARNRDTAAESVHRITGGGAQTLVGNGSGAVLQPLPAPPPCECDRLQVTRIRPYSAFVNDRGMRITLFLTWQLRCTDGGGRCRGRVDYAPSAGDRARGLALFRGVGPGRRLRATSLTCAGPCDKASDGTTTLRLVGGRMFAEEKLGRAVRSVTIEVDRFCGGRRLAPQTFELVFLAGPRGPLDIPRSDTNGNGIPDGRERQRGRG